MKIILARVAVLLVAYSITVIASLSLASAWWPEGIGNEAEIIFWPATGVALFFVLRYGPMYAPVIFLSTLPAIVFAKDPPVQAILGASGNVLEVLIGWTILTRLGRFAGTFDKTRVVAALALTSIIGGIASALYPIYQGAIGMETGEVWVETVLRFGFANGCGTMIVCVFLFALINGNWRFQKHPKEAVAWLVVSLLIISFAFDAVFRAETNYAFLVFPLVIFAAIRFGTAECASALVLVVAGIYVALVQNGAAMPETEVLPIIQFIQAFTWVLSITGLFVAALVAERRHAQKETLAEKGRLFEVELSKERARLEALRYQINPHFLFNSINSVCASLPDTTSNTRTMLAELSDYLRSVLDHPDGDFSPLENELDSIRKYVAIEQQRYGDDLELEVAADPTLVDVRIPVFLLQPLVENAIRHGFDSGSERIRIDIVVRAQNDIMVLEVKNNGSWIDKTKTEGLGLKNVRRRLDMLYAGRAQLEQEADGGYVSIRILIPMNIKQAKTAITG